MIRRNLKYFQGFTKWPLNKCIGVRCLAQKTEFDRVKAARAKLQRDHIEDVKSTMEITPSCLARFGGSSSKKWSQALEENPLLYNVKKKDLINSLEFLKNLNFSADEILSRPMVLYSNAITLENRMNVLKECGFEKITIGVLHKYLTVMNKSIILLKSYSYLPYHINMVEQLRKAFTDLDLQLPDEFPRSEETELKALRQQMLSCYLQQKLEVNEEDLTKLWKVYCRMRHRSFQSVQEMLKVLIEDLNFPKERIIKNGFLLYGEPDNVKRILKEIPKIGGEDIKEIVYRRPKILMSSCDCLVKTLEHVKNFGISEDAILRCLEVLTLGSDTVLERLRELNDIEEFQVLGTNPRVLRLVHYQNKARVRLEYLNQLKVKCASLHILSCGSEAFAKFARNGSDKSKGRDIVVFLGKVMNKDENDLRNLLSRHPNWCHVSPLQVKQCYDYLIEKKFTDDEIYENIHILLYPIYRIDEKLSELYSKDFYDPHVNLNNLSNSDILRLILYYIESEYHFTGDGIWTEEHSHQLENFNNLLPDFPESLNKVYKYGMKPAPSVQTITQEIFMRR